MQSEGGMQWVARDHSQRIPPRFSGASYCREFARVGRPVPRMLLLFNGRQLQQTRQIPPTSLHNGGYG